jgi:DNA-binding SARP family transcriptional activator/tetratricopeptide (TPR) repeat protein/TolB-like protein
VLRLLTFGGLGIMPDDGQAAPRLRPPRLALLAVLAAAGDRGVSRDRLASLFWPDADDGRAAHSLRQARYALRQDLGCEVVRTAGSTLVLDETLMSSDVAEFRAALAAGDRARAVALVSGPFLDGFYLPGASAFERWAEEERGHLSASMTAALLFLAAEAARSGDRDAAVEWWRQLTVRDPLSGRFAVGYLKALAARGDRAEGLAFARLHEATVRRELETDPDPEVRRIEAELRAMLSPDVARPHVVSPAVSLPAVQSDTLSSSIETVAAAPPSIATRIRPQARRALVLFAAAALTVAATASVARQRGWLGKMDSTPVLAVGFIREDAMPDSQRVGRVLTDMLATNLARVEGLSVLANTRLLELVKPGQDSAAGLADAARRAGATDLLEGRLHAVAPRRLSLDMRRVDLRTGLVTGVYQVIASDQYALVDSLTIAVTRPLRLTSPASSVADATTTSPTAYRLYTEGLRSYYLFDYNAALRLMHAALVEDSTFAMAAYYEVQAAAQLSYNLPDGRHITAARRAVLRLASRAPERERLTITANILSQDWEPRALMVAESLATRYPGDPRSHSALGNARLQRGDWAGAAAAFERAIALDSVAETKDAVNCILCRDYSALGDVYLWSDSLAAAERTARRYRAAKPELFDPWYLTALAAARRGDSTAAYAAFRRLADGNADNRHLKLRLDITLDDYDVLEREVQPMLSSSLERDFNTASWAYLIALRNQGRLREATLFHRTGALPGFTTLAVQHAPDGINDAILAFERGEPRIAAEVFAKQNRADLSRWSPGYASRIRTWNGTLEGMALAAAGDTLAVRALADSVERWGSGSAYGRDRIMHHYLRGMVFAAARRDEDAAREFAAAISSPTLGFTRVNYELAKSLLRLKRPAEAIAALQPALRGEIDASNLYITRTELHELLARAFDAAGKRDSAAAHYRSVVRAWQKADPPFHTRRDSAQAWLTRNH